MGYACGFDIFPPLTDSIPDKKAYSRLLRSVQDRYAHDLRVIPRAGYYEFAVGEHPKLPRDGTKLLCFSSQVGAALTQAAEPYIRQVSRLAKESLGSARVHFWHELADRSSAYSSTEVRASQSCFIMFMGPGQWSEDIGITTRRKLAEAGARHGQGSERRVPGLNVDEISSVDEAVSVGESSSVDQGLGMGGGLNMNESRVAGQERDNERKDSAIDCPDSDEQDSLQSHSEGEHFDDQESYTAGLTEEIAGKAVPGNWSAVNKIATILKRSRS